MSKLLPILYQYLQEDPEDPFNHYAYAVELSKLEPQNALTMMLDIVERFSDYLPIYYTAASLASDLEAYQQAIELVKAGIKVAERANESKALSELRRLLTNIEAEL